MYKKQVGTVAVSGVRVPKGGSGKWEVERMGRFHFAVREQGQTRLLH